MLHPSPFKSQADRAVKVGFQGVPLYPFATSLKGRTCGLATEYILARLALLQDGSSPIKIQNWVSLQSVADSQDSVCPDLESLQKIHGQKEEEAESRSYLVHSTVRYHALPRSSPASGL